MTTNLSNFAVLKGRLTKDIVSFLNKDGSRKVLVTIAVDNNWVNKADGKRGTQFINLEAFLPANVQGLGAYEHMHSGDLVSFGAHVESDQYKGKDGQTVYAQKIVIDQVQFEEPRSVTQARLAQRVANAANQATAGDAAVPAAATVQDSPFA